MTLCHILPEDMVNMINTLTLPGNLKKTVEHESDVYTNCNWCSCHSHRWILKVTGGLGNKRTSEDLPDYYIIEIGLNTEKKARRLEKTYSHSNFSERPSANADVKNSQGVNNYNKRVQLTSAENIRLDKIG